MKRVSLIPAVTLVCMVVLVGCVGDNGSSTYGMTTTVAGVGTGGISGSGVGAIVLGSRMSFGPYGRGWGRPYPSSLDNDGDPSGNAWRLRWTGWGSPVARATGLTYVLDPAPGTGYRKGRLQLRASRIGHCYGNGPLAYTRLAVRVASLHRGSFSAWQLWNGRPNLCHA
jgi:hypothetical protein